MAWIVVIRKEGDALCKARILRRQDLGSIGRYIRQIAMVRKTVDWSDAMDHEIRRYYYLTSAALIAKALSEMTGQTVSRNSVISRARKLGIKRPTR